MPSYLRWAAIELWRGSHRPAGLATVYSLAVWIVGLPAAIVGVGIDVTILFVLRAVLAVRPARLRPVLPW